MDTIIIIVDSLFNAGRTMRYLLFKISLTFVCFLATLIALFYLGLGDGVDGLAKRLSSLETIGSKKVFYRTIGNDVVDRLPDDDGQVASSYSLELAVFQSQNRASKMVTNLLKRGIRAFYIEVQNDQQAVVYSVRKGVFSSLTAARSASAALLAQRKLTNRVVELY